MRENISGNFAKCKVKLPLVTLCGFRYNDPMASGYNGYAHFRDGCTRETNPGKLLGNVPDKCRCNNTAKSTGERCKNVRVKGDTRCRTHGGKRPGMKVSRAKQLRMAARLRGERPKHYWCD
jgi:hypothetical protein